MKRGDRHETVLELQGGESKRGREKGGVTLTCLNEWVMVA